MKLFRTSLIFALLIFGIEINHIQSQQAWTLEECIQYALDNNIQIKQQELSVDVALENLQQSRADRFPSLNASASHAYNFGRTIDPFTNEFATETVRTNNFNLSSGLILFSGFQITNAIRQNFLEYKASQHDVEAMKNDISLAVASSYLQILFNIELLEIARNQLEVTNQQVEQTSRLVEAGTLARGSLLTIQAQAATEELQVINAENNLELAYLELTQLLDLENPEDFTVVVPEISMDAGLDHIYSPMNVYLNAVETQPGILASGLRVESAGRSVAIARGSLSPSLSVRGSYGTGYSGASREVVNIIPGEPVEIGQTPDGTPVLGPSFDYETQVIPFQDQLDANLNRSLGFVLSIPIFNNLQARAAVSRSKIALENARLNNELQKNELFKVIQQSYADAVAAHKRYDATGKNVRALEEAFRYTEQRFNIGMVASVEYNDAKNRLTTAQSELLQAKYEYVFRSQILEFYMGKPIRF